MSDFTEVADRVWVARYAWFDVNVSVVAGANGLLVVDTNASRISANDSIAISNDLLVANALDDLSERCSNRPHDADALAGRGR